VSNLEHSQKNFATQLAGGLVGCQLTRDHWFWPTKDQTRAEAVHEKKAQLH